VFGVEKGLSVWMQKKKYWCGNGRRTLVINTVNHRYESTVRDRDVGAHIAHDTVYHVSKVGVNIARDLEFFFLFFSRSTTVDLSALFGLQLVYALYRYLFKLIHL
jgi:hypothetical protein